MGILIFAELLAATVYMQAVALEDSRTCQVTRWKHLIGFLPAITLLIINPYRLRVVDYACILLFTLLFFLFAGIKVYGLADGFVLANLTLLFGGIGGLAGVGMVILIIIIASMSMLLCHAFQAVRKKQKVLINASGAFIPHLLTGYLAALSIMLHGMMQ